MNLRQLSLFIFIAILIAFSGCSLDTGDWFRQLPGGYNLSRICKDQGKEVCDIGNSERQVVVYPQIDGIQIYGPVIIGHNEPHSLTGDHKQMEPDSNATMFGYFIIDTATNKIEKGLSRDEWTKLLAKRYGLKEVHLKWPCRDCPLDGAP
jgi:hypothetical protein